MRKANGLGASQICRWGTSGLVVAGLVFSASIARSQAPRPRADVADPAIFEVLSIKLNMTGQEVIDALKEYGPVVSMTRFGDELYGNVKVHTVEGQYVPGKKYVTNVTLYAKDQFGLKVDFVEVYPFDASRREAVWSISYEPKVTTKADVADFQKRVHEKYGPPSERYEGWNGLQDKWCGTHIEKSRSGKKVEARCDLADGVYPQLVLRGDSSANMRLTNLGLKMDMQKAFDNTRTGAQPPL